MIAVRNVAVDEELTYDYGVRTEGWMKVKGGGTRRRETSDEGEEARRDGTHEMKVALESHDGEEGQRGGDCKTPRSYKRNYFWCPEPDCASGPVQKITQHLKKVHKMSPQQASKVARTGPPRGCQAQDAQSRNTLQRRLAFGSLLQESDLPP